MATAGFSSSRNVKERLHRLRNFQSQDFWAMVFARPLTILLLLPVADWAWITPNGITLASVLLKLAGLGAFWWLPSYWGGVAGALLLNLGLVFDNMDGTLARYRTSGTFLGYYLDKAVDIVCLAGLFAVIGLRAWRETEMVADLFLPMMGFAGASVAGYCKWVAYRVETDIQLWKHREEGTLDDLVTQRLDQNPSTPPPNRSPMDWLQWFLRAVKSILSFNEVDIFFFLLLALVLGEVTLFTRYMSSFYALGMVIGPGLFYFKLRTRLAAQGLR